MKRHGIIPRTFAANALLLICAAAIVAQQPSSSPNIRSSSDIPAPNQPQTPALATPSYLTPIHGTQGVLAETLDGASIAAQSIDDRFNPASSIKLATALAALKAFGPDYRFPTSIWATGKVDPATGNLQG